MYLLSACLLIFLSSTATFASCSGVKGCNPCYDSLLITSKEDVKCESALECVAIEHRCGGYYLVNKAHSAKFEDKKIKQGEPKKMPKLICKFEPAWDSKVCGIMN